MKLLQEKWTLWIGSLALAGAIVWQAVRALKWGHDSWGLTEWLINYQGGFVRRGLPGELILITSDWSGIQANLLVVALSMVLYLVLLFYFLSKTKKLFLPLLILSPVVMGGPAFQDFIVRKDVLGVLFLLICVKILHSGISKAAKYFGVNLVSIIAILSHESFFFFAIPAILIIISSLSTEDTIFRAKKFLNAALVMLPTLIAFVYTTIHKGNTNTAYAINLSWIDLWRVIEPANCCLDKPAGAIDSIQWSLKQGLSLSASIFTYFSMGIYVPLAWILTIIICGYFVLSFSKNLSKIEHQNLARIIIFQLLMISPLFVLGWDFGRWIFLWTSSSLILFINGLKINSNILSAKKFTNYFNAQLYERISKNEWLLLVFGVPVCCWTVAWYINSTPLAPYIELSKKMARLLSRYFY